MKVPVNCYQGFASALLLTVLTTSSPAISVASEFETALRLIDRMGQAAKSLNYKGVFVYLRNGQLKAIRVIHKADESGEYERLISLNGVPREIIRNNELVTCILPDDKAMLMDGHRYPHKDAARGKNFHDKNGFPRHLPAELKAMHEHYRFSLGEAGRIVGRKTQQIIIIPKDQYRYGYRLWVDSETGLLLKTIMVGENNRALEQVMFTSLSLLEKVSDADLAPAVTGREFSWRESEPLNIDASDYESRWKIGWIPAGFTLVARGKHLLPNSQVPVEHLVYSDGLGSVSIFIERIIGAHQSHLRGFSSMGAVNAYGTTQALHYLTVVGDVPHATVERIGKSIHYVSSSTEYGVEETEDGRRKSSCNNKE